jgi:DNA-binding CsgD family transcriptional regulator
MSKLVENYVERYIKGHHKRMKQICEPLQQFFGINYFTYHSLTSDGFWRPFVSRLDWADYFTENELFLQDPFLCHPHSYQSGAVFWTPYYQHDPNLQGVLKIARDKFSMAHGFCIIERTQEGCEFFGFNAPPQHEQIYSTYFQDLSLLKEFCKYFKKEAAPILKLLDHDPIPLLSLKGEAFETTSSPFEQLQQSKSLFLKFIRAEQPVKLSKREIECLSLYLDTQKMQEVADLLELSVRTIEFYLGNIKNKLNCWNKTELMKKGQEMRSLGLIP